VLFLDEPTSGLDSASACSVIGCLKTLAEGAGLTIAAIVHQPSYAVGQPPQGEVVMGREACSVLMHTAVRVRAQAYYMMHDVLYLNDERKSVYYGPTKDSVRAFQQEYGKECDWRVNPADFIMSLLNPKSGSEEGSPLSRTRTREAQTDAAALEEGQGSRQWWRSWRDGG
jgi:hypothetical protein